MVRIIGLEALAIGEHRAATFAAEGLTNRGIAERLFVTQRTVETHLQHAFRNWPSIAATTYPPPCDNPHRPAPTGLDRCTMEVTPDSTTSHLEVPATPANRSGDVMSNALRPTAPEPSPPVTGNASPSTPATPPVAVPPGRTPRTRTGATWFGICTAALVVVVLIIFMLQNTDSVEVSFLWMHGNLPLALALLIAGIGTAIVAMVVGAARITQLRRLSRRQRS